MNDTRKTLTFAAVAVVLAVLAFILAPSKYTPEAFLDQGEGFFPDFTDPNEAITLEVIDYDEATGSAHPFKVTFENGMWVIPSHHGYPADAKDRLARTAAGVIGIKKDDFRSDNVADHEACGVIDPLDETATGLAGRGKRVTLKGSGDQVLADFIVGKEVQGRPGFRFVRVPDQKRVYAVRMDIDVSTRFQDWIEVDLLKTDKDKIASITVNDYSVNERTGSVNRKDNLSLNLNEDTWSARGIKKTQTVDSTAMMSFLDAIDTLKIVGVRPKPEGLSAGLKQNTGGQTMTNADLRSLQSKGYYMTRDGQLMSNEGELVVATSEGVIYTLRFGEVLYGSGLAVTAGGAEEQSKTGPAENRYLFITADFDASMYPEPPRPSDSSFMEKADSLYTDNDRRNRDILSAHKKWHQQYSKARSTAEERNARFADWYYVISSSSWEQLNLGRSDLIVSK